MSELELKALQDEIKNELKGLKEAQASFNTKSEAEKADLNVKMIKHDENIQKLSEQADALALQLKDQKLNGKRENPFAEMKTALTDAKVRAELKAGGQRTFELKVSTIDEATELSNGTTNLSSAVVVPFREQGIGKAPDNKITLLDLISRATINSNRVSWVERSARTDGMSTNATAAVSEAAQYPQSDFTWIQKFAPVEKIGTFIKVTNEVLEDWDQALNEIKNELFPMVERAVERAVFNGTGVSPQMQGIVDTGIAAAFTETGLNGLIITPNHFDVLRAAFAQLALANYTPNAVMVNPIDGAMMDLPKNADGVYLLPPFIGVDRRSIAGVRVVESNLIPAGYFLMGDFTKDTLFTKRAIEIKIWDQDSTDPEYDLKTITASVRAVNRIKTPDYNAFVYDTFAAVVDLIKTV